MHKSSIFVCSLVVFICAAWVAVSSGWGVKENEYLKYFDQKLEMRAKIVSDPQRPNLYAQRFEIIPTYRSSGGTQNFSQKILVTTYNRMTLRYGDDIYMVGKIKMPENFSENFNYIGYLQAKNIYAQMSATEIYVLNHTIQNPIIYYGLKIKHAFYERLQKYLPKESSALLIALLVGDKGLMAKERVQEFSNTGVAHLIAVSSYILTIVLLLASQLKPFLGSSATITLCVLIITLYLIMADFSSGVLRAAIMFALLFICRILGKQYSIFPVLIFTAAALVAFNPLIIKYDLGFMFSFSAILGIIFFAPHFQAFFAKWPKIFRERFAIREILATTLAAQLATVPLTVYYFQQVPLISPLANLLVIPIVTPTVIAGYLLIVPIIAPVIAKLLIIPLSFILGTVHVLAGFKYASISQHISARVFVLLYALELGAYFLLRYLGNKKKSQELMTFKDL